MADTQTGHTAGSAGPPTGLTTPNLVVKGGCVGKRKEKSQREEEERRDVAVAVVAVAVGRPAVGSRQTCTAWVPHRDSVVPGFLR
eukprot:scaffold2489_cov110-Isochrysis_galbana.AAC.15